MIVHNIPPVYDAKSKILILGSFPSVKSRETKFFYGHKQNRFWKVTSTVFNCNTPETIEEKRKFLHDNHIALWDVIASCEIEGSSDSSIKNVKPNDIAFILDSTDIKKIFVNGRTAEKYYKKYVFPLTGIEAIFLPSTSPANASVKIDFLIEQWQIIKQC